MDLLTKMYLQGSGENASAVPEHGANVSMGTLRRIDKMSREQLLVLLGKAILEDWMIASRYTKGPDAKPQDVAYTWLQHNAPRMAQLLGRCGLSCNKIPLQLRRSDFAHCVELFQSVEWIPAPVVASAYCLRYATQCPVFSQFTNRKKKPVH